MTWVLGSGVPFGYGALISDVRVTWRDGRHLDRLQKITGVSPIRHHFERMVAIARSSTSSQTCSTS
jgi:hypothetical protein